MRRQILLDTNLKNWQGGKIEFGSFGLSENDIKTKFDLERIMCGMIDETFVLIFARRN